MSESNDIPTDHTSSLCNMWPSSHEEQSPAQRLLRENSSTTYGRKTTNKDGTYEDKCKRVKALVTPWSAVQQSQMHSKAIQSAVTRTNQSKGDMKRSSTPLHDNRYNYRVLQRSHPQSKLYGGRGPPWRHHTNIRAALVQACIMKVAAATEQRIRTAAAADLDLACHCLDQDVPSLPPLSMSNSPARH